MLLIILSFSKIPRASTHLASNITPHFLKKCGFLEAIEESVEQNTPGIRHYSATHEEKIVNGKRVYEAAFESVPSCTVFIQANSVWAHRDRHPVTETAGNDSNDEMVQNTSDLQNEEDGNQVFMDDAIEDQFSGDKSPSKKVDLPWEPSSQLVDSRLANPQEYFQGHCSVRVPKDANLEAYFLLESCFAF